MSLLQIINRLDHAKYEMNKNTLDLELRRNVAIKMVVGKLIHLCARLATKNQRRIIHKGQSCRNLKWDFTWQRFVEDLRRGTRLLLLSNDRIKIGADLF